MTVTVSPSTVTSLIAGDTWSWSIVDSDRSPANGWALSFRFSGATNFPLTVTTNATGDGWDITHAAATTASVSTGRYEWFARASLAADAVTIARGQLTVQPNITATGIDGRSNSRVALEAIEAMIAGRASAAQKMYEIAGRKVEFFSLPELLKARDKLRIDVSREDACANAAAGLADRRRVIVSFR